MGWSWLKRSVLPLRVSWIPAFLQLSQVSSSSDPITDLGLGSSPSGRTIYQPVAVDRCTREHFRACVEYRTLSHHVLA